MAVSDERGMIVQAVNSRDGLTYGASIIEKRKQIVIRNEFPTGVDAKAWVAAFGRATTFDILHEAAVWRGAMKPFTVPPLLLLELADSTRRVRQEEFGALVNDILTNGNLSDLDGAEIEVMLRKRRFRTWRHVLRTFPLMKKIPAFCAVAIDPDDEHEQLLRDLGWESGQDEPQSDTPNSAISESDCIRPGTPVIERTLLMADDSPIAMTGGYPCRKRGSCLRMRRV